MRRFILLLLAIMIPFSLFSDDSVLDSGQRKISAFKTAVANDIPTPTVVLRFMNSYDENIENGGIISLPDNSRSSNYNAFTWILSGNVYGSVVVTFSFGPMYLNGLPKETTSTDDSTKVIPYTVTLSHTATRVGNTTIGQTKRTSASGAPIYFSYDGTTYDFYYADSVSITNAGSQISTTAQTASVSYNMQTNTFVSNYPSVNVCSFWNRYGLGVVNLGINANATGKADGIYRANVLITISGV